MTHEQPILGWHAAYGVAWYGRELDQSSVLSQEFAQDDDAISYERRAEKLERVWRAGRSAD